MDIIAVLSASLDPWAEELLEVLRQIASLFARNQILSILRDLGPGFLLLTAFLMTVWILEAVGLYTLAKRRGIRNPWLAWFPIGNHWILGSLCDGYCRAVGRGDPKRRILMIWLTVAIDLLEGAFIAVFFVMLLSIMALNLSAMMVSLIVLMSVSFASALIGIAHTVFYYICVYDLYKSSRPQNAVVFLVVTILLNNALTSFFIFACRNRDDGMPHRNSAPVPGRYPHPGVWV